MIEAEKLASETEPVTAEVEPVQTQTKEEATEQEIEATAGQESHKPVREVVEEAPADDLTLIQGIGPGRRKLLNKAGIFTFVQLAGADPSQLRESLGESSRLADINKWIDQALELVRYKL